MSLESVVVIGGGVAGFATARELRARGHTGRLAIIDPEGLPYDRPPLSKQYLMGTQDAARLAFEPAEWFAAHGIEVVHGTAAALDPAAGRVTLEDGTTTDAGAVVLAPGAAARRLDIPGADHPGVLELRTRADADRLRPHLRPGARIVVVGGGLIGAEAASAALALGATVDLVEPVDPPLVPVVGPDLARRLHAMHAERGIRVHGSVPVAITPPGAASPSLSTPSDGVRPAGGAGPGVVPGPRRVLLADGTALEADAVLVGIGIVPRTALAEAAGLAVEDGILVDAAGRTSHPRVFAVGDAARTRLADGTLLRRAEHWEAALNSGTTAAAALLRQAPPAHGAPWFWSDRHGVHVEGVGRMAGAGTHVVRVEGGVPVAAFLVDDGGRLAGCAAVDGGLTVRAARRIIDRGIPVDPAQLADPSVPLKKLAR
ncbi:NAD(P)/FAD-dependent oxidoreductase [Zafaria sp. J156]|uniref:NAD(P)/FAD-dependent oxidoreductase n=1 Tax=Zafaria sp. J156 TaxID=3116490 RepID=UPI002E75FD6E|nr:FAD-dependent oxidoreductase [Zafaria sp. J156]MEE1620931.1 FAD-dependent oxidoreductase [Zafaria sp. J156]